MNGLSREFIIHPGETLAELMTDRTMSQKELALRTGVTEKHVSTIINGLKPISVAYAKKLEYALGIDASFWINLQSNYNREIMEFDEVNGISSTEIAIIKPLKPIIEHLGKMKLLNPNDPESILVLDLRKFLGISSLADVPSMMSFALYRTQTAAKTDPYILFAWHRLCEYRLQGKPASNELNLSLLKDKVPEIKQLMFARANAIREDLQSLFAECGIIFDIVRHFPGAPVQGFIKINDHDKMVMCLTIRQGFADRFWFTLFHEIAHILHGDVKQQFLDFETTQNQLERRADLYASNVLIRPDAYRQFIQVNDFSLQAIERFSGEQRIRPFIVIGRLKKEGLLDWDRYPGQMIRYKWANE